MTDIRLLPPTHCSPICTPISACDHATSLQKGTRTRRPANLAGTGPALPFFNDATSCSHLVMKTLIFRFVMSKSAFLDSSKIIMPFSRGVALVSILVSIPAVASKDLAISAESAGWADGNGATIMYVAECLMRSIAENPFFYITSRSEGTASSVRMAVCTVLLA